MDGDDSLSKGSFKQWIAKQLTFIFLFLYCFFNNKK